MKCRIVIALALLLPLTQAAHAELNPVCRQTYERYIDQYLSSAHVFNVGAATGAIASTAALVIPAWKFGFMAAGLGASGLAWFAGASIKEEALLRQQILSSVEEAEASAPGASSQGFAEYVTETLNRPYSLGAEIPDPVNNSQRLAVLNHLGTNRVTPEHIANATRWLVEKNALCTPEGATLDTNQWLQMMYWALSAAEPKS